MSKCTTSLDGNTLTFRFSTGETLAVDANTLPPAIATRLMFHGLEQKVRDAFAGASPEEAPGLARKVVDRLVAGEWAVRRTGGKAKPTLAQAIAIVLQRAGKPVPPDLEAQVEALSRSERAKLRFDPRIAAVMAELSPKRGEDALAAIGL